MPVYEYKCKTCEDSFDIEQSFADDALTTLEGCQKTDSGDHNLRKVFSAVGIAFKGEGFYRNDSRSGTTSTAGTSAKGSDTSESSSTSSSESSSGSSPSDSSSNGGDSASTKSSGTATKSESSSKSDSKPTKATSPST